MIRIVGNHLVETDSNKFLNIDEFLMRLDRNHWEKINSGSVLRLRFQKNNFICQIDLPNEIMFIQVPDWE